MTFRTRLFLTSLGTAALTLAVATVSISWSVRNTMHRQIERGLVHQTRLAAEALSHRRPAEGAELDAEADALARRIGVRVTFVAPDGTVLGDSDLDAPALRAVENHATRPEVAGAARDGLGIARRYSTTIRTDMLYVAVPVRNPDLPSLSVVRLALPLYEVREQLRGVVRIALGALGVALVGALGLSWAASVLLTRRVRGIAAVAGRYAAGDLSRPPRDYGADEIGTVARALDESVREIGRRAAALASDRARMLAILGGMIEGVLVVNDQGRVRLVNPAARRMLGLQDEPHDRHYLEIVRHPDIAAQIGAALGGRTTEGFELVLPRDRDRLIAARSAPVADPSGSGAVLVMHDITELRRADRIRRDFVANVSHELRTPLTAVRGYVEALLDGGADPAESRRFLEVIGRHTLRMERLVRDLLRLARLDARQEPLEHVTCATEALLSGVQAELSDLIESRQQTLECRIAGDAGTIEGDPAKLHDALRNLVENATNYSPGNSRIAIDVTRNGEWIAITVTDEGPGIPEADLPRVFERFYRVDKARSRGGRDTGGTGLGLAIVRHLVELHGGTVRAANGPSGGAVFVVALPASRRQAGGSREATARW